MRNQKRRVSRLVSSCCGAMIVLTIPPVVAAQEEAAPDLELVREQIEERYDEWAAARLAYDREALESMVTEDFHILLYGREISGEQFIEDVSKRTPRGHLTRFDASVLTLRPSEDGWTVVISEKLEFEITDEEGEVQKGHALWVTRDGWRQVDGEWLVSLSEAIGHQSWKPGEVPPIPHW